MSSEWLETVYGMMPATLDCARLGDLCEEAGVQTGPFGSQLHQEDYVDIGTPIITVEHLGENRISHINLPKVSDEDYKRLAKYTLKKGDIVFSRVGSVDRRALVQQAEDGWLFSGRCLRVRPKKDSLDSEWLSYFFGLPTFKNYIRGIAVGATMPSLNTKLLSDVPIYFPSLEIQRSCATVLSQIDNRITLLRETNASLEAIAQSLFKSWFVDFDPVHANAHARAQHQNSHSQAVQPNPAPHTAEAMAQSLGLDAATAALFPDHFQDSDLGPIPAGWECKMLGEICSYISRGISPKYVEDDGVLVINQKCIREFSVDTEKARRHDSTARKITGREIQVGDVLVNSTGVGTLGRLAQVLDVQETMIVDSHVTVVRTNNDVPWTYLGQWMIKHQPIIEDMGEGSTGQTELSRSKLADLMVLVPSSDALKEFDKKVIGLKNKVSLNNQKAQTLTQLRDTLLPRLISGQLRLPEAEAQIEAVVGGA